MYDLKFLNSEYIAVILYYTLKIVFKDFLTLFYDIIIVPIFYLCVEIFITENCIFSVYFKVIISLYGINKSWTLIS